MAKKHHPLKSDARCPALEALIGDGGQITLGAVGPVRNAAIAAMPAGMLAALVRRPGETLRRFCSDWMPPSCRLSLKTASSTR
jgi:hypothetical protein